MKFTMKNMPIGLAAKRTPLEITDAGGTTLRVLRGRVWITQEGSVDDVFLDAGSGHTFRADGKVLISAEGSQTDGATIVFDAPLSVAERTTFVAALKRLIAWHSASLSTSYEGI